LPNASVNLLSQHIRELVVIALLAFKYIVGIPFSYSTADGLALGFISCAVVNGLSARAREFTIVLMVCFVLVRSRMG